MYFRFGLSDLGPFSWIMSSLSDICSKALYLRLST